MVDVGVETIVHTDEHGDTSVAVTDTEGVVGTANTTDVVADASVATDATVVSGPAESESNLATCHPHYSVQPAPPVQQLY